MPISQESLPTEQDITKSNAKQRIIDERFRGNEPAYGNKLGHIALANERYSDQPVDEMDYGRKVTIAKAIPKSNTEE